VSGTFIIKNGREPYKVCGSLAVQRRLDFLKNHKRVLCSSLLMSGKLRAHLHEIDGAAFERW
jgi:hypothetical protein